MRHLGNAPRGQGAQEKGYQMTWTKDAATGAFVALALLAAARLVCWLAYVVWA